MSFPDTEECASAVQSVSPLAAQRLRQYARLTQTQQKTITELQTNLTEKCKELDALRLLHDELLTERNQLRQRIPAEPQPDRMAELAGRIEALESRLAAE